MVDKRRKAKEGASASRRRIKHNRRAVDRRVTSKASAHGASVPAEEIKKAKEAVQKVIKQILDTVDEHDYEPEDGLADLMFARYLYGFIEAFKEIPDFWDLFGEKVLRMARYVGAFACYFVERTRPFTEARKGTSVTYEVRETDWLMAMGVVRSACLAGTHVPRGLPCAKENFKIEADIKAAVVLTFGEIASDLMSDDID